MSNATTMNLGVREMSMNIINILSKEIAEKIMNNKIKVNDDLISSGFTEKNLSTFKGLDEINDILKESQLISSEISKDEMDDLFGEKDTGEANRILNSFGDNKNNQNLS